MVTVLFRVCGSVSDVVDAASQLKANKALDVAFVDKTDEKPAATHEAEAPRKRKRTSGLVRSKPGERMMDYVIKAMQTAPSKTWTISELASLLPRMGCSSSKAKLSNGLYPCMSTLKVVLDMVENAGPSAYRLTDTGRKTQIPIPFTMSGEKLSV